MSIRRESLNRPIDLPIFLEFQVTGGIAAGVEAAVVAADGGSNPIFRSQIQDMTRVELEISGEPSASTKVSLLKLEKF